MILPTNKQVEDVKPKNEKINDYQVVIMDTRTIAKGELIGMLGITQPVTVSFPGIRP